MVSTFKCFRLIVPSFCQQSNVPSSPILGFVSSPTFEAYRFWFVSAVKRLEFLCSNFLSSAKRFKFIGSNNCQPSRVSSLLFLSCVDRQMFQVHRFYLLPTVNRLSPSILAFINRQMFQAHRLYLSSTSKPNNSLILIVGYPSMFLSASILIVFNSQTFF